MGDFDETAYAARVAAANRDKIDTAVAALRLQLEALVGDHEIINVKVDVLAVPRQPILIRIVKPGDLDAPRRSEVEGDDVVELGAFRLRPAPEPEQ